MGLDGTLWIGDPESKQLLVITPDRQIVRAIHSLSLATAADQTLGVHGDRLGGTDAIRDDGPPATASRGNTP